MKSRILGLMAFTLLFLTGVETYAASKTVFSREYPRVMSSVRALGMGNAYFGVSDDKYAAFYNPAGLGMSKSSWSIDIVPLQMGVNDNLFDNSQSIANLFLKGSNFDQQAVTNILNGMLGQYNNVTPINFFPAFTMKKGRSAFSVGIFANASAKILTYNRVLPEAALKVQGDAGVTVTYAHTFLEDESLHFGVSLMGLYRMGYEGSYVATDFASINFNNEINKLVNSHGWGILASVGLMYEMPWLRKELNPRVGISFNDFGYTNFASSLDKITPTLNLSLAISPKWEFISSNIVLDLNDILVMNGSDKDFGKRVNFGVEVGFWNRLFIRGGVHQGYLTAGAGVDLWALRLNYAYYTEEMGAYAGQFKDTRHAIEVVIGWNQLKKQRKPVKKDSN